MKNALLILFGKLLSFVSQTLNLGHGSTWPGHIALSVNQNFIKDIVKQTTKNQRLKTILIAGTNGKTTTGKLIRSILETNGFKVFQNESGANLLNGIASSILLHSSILSILNYDYGIFEVDENSLPIVLKELNPDYLILLNLFRDQLDRYGEIHAIANKWKKAIENLPSSTNILLNADDPQIASICHPELARPERGRRVSGSRLRVFYFGLNDRSLHQKSPQHAVDSIYCPNCGNKLAYKTVYFSHLGDWQCKKCGNKRPQLEDTSLSYIYPLVGLYNRYNTHAAILFAKLNNIQSEIIKEALKSFIPAFGRQEIIDVNSKRVQIFLSKNPTSFNQSLHTVKKLGGRNILLALNDRIPDGRDVSWIWDVDTEELIENNINIVVSGDRAYDMGLRLKYSSSSEFLISNFKFSIKILNFKFQIEEDLKSAIALALKQTPETETLYILPTYSAMLEVRKILTGRKIL